MYKLILTALFSITLMVGFGQLDKGVWIVGGNASLLAAKVETQGNNTTTKANTLNISINPGVGYFIAEKLAAGLRTSYTKEWAKVTETTNTTIGSPFNIDRFQIGPFVRYYLLDTERPFNLLADVNYIMGWNNFHPNSGTSNTFSALFGPVIYFNSSVGIEFLAGYNALNEEFGGSTQIKNQRSGFQFSIGFQIHLEK